MICSNLQQYYALYELFHDNIYQWSFNHIARAGKATQ